MFDNKSETLVDQAPFVGDHLALDMLNSDSYSYGKKIDYWVSGQSVLVWLNKAYRGERLYQHQGLDMVALLSKARFLRSTAHQLIIERKNGVAIDTTPINEFLKQYKTALNLEYDDDNLILVRRSLDISINSMLGPLAESVAQLLVDADFSLIKQCEHPDCVLWFYDKTRSHRRRWCSMATCGNKSKAARYREKAAR